MDSDTTIGEILYVMDFVGRILCGEVVEKDETNITLINPLLVVEQQIAPDKISTGMKPLLFCMEIKNIKFKWAGIIEPDQTAIDRYKETVVQFRAAKSNIELATGVPANLPGLRQN